MSKLVTQITLGGATQDQGTRQLGWGLPETGYKGAAGLTKAVEDCGRVVGNAGLPYRLMLTNPWGTQADEAVDFDQRLEAQRTVPKIADFEEWCEDVVRPLVETSDGELIIYLGSMIKDLDMVQHEGDPEAYRSRVHRSLLGVPKWASICFDQGGITSPDSQAYAVMLGERNGGRRVYVEPRPSLIATGCHDWPVVSTYDHWYRSDPRNFADAATLFPPVETRGDAETIVLIREQNQTEWITRLIQVLDDGLTAAVPYNGILDFAVDTCLSRTYYGT